MQLEPEHTPLLSCPKVNIYSFLTSENSLKSQLERIFVFTEHVLNETFMVYLLYASTPKNNNLWFMTFS
jgi:hypothetical protein